MVTKKSHNLVLFKIMISVISVQLENMVRIIDELLCEYFKTSNEKVYIFMKTIFNKDCIEFDDKINFLKFISYIKCDDEYRTVFIKSIGIAEKFYRIKHMIVYEKTRLCGDYNKFHVKIVSNNKHYEIHTITPVTVDIVREEAEETLVELENAKKYFS